MSDDVIIAATSWPPPNSLYFPHVPPNVAFTFPKKSSFYNHVQQQPADS
jgi:hypothetical protein